MYTQNEILTDIYNLLKVSPIGTLTGNGTKSTRATGSEKEDWLVAYTSGSAAKFLQYAGITIKIFYKDIEMSNTYMENSTRGQELEKLLIDFSEVLLGQTKYSFITESRQTYIVPIPEIHQHMAVLKINLVTTIK